MTRAVNWTLRNITAAGDIAVNGTLPDFFAKVYKAVLPINVKMSKLRCKFSDIMMLTFRLCSEAICRPMMPLYGQK